MTLKNLAIVFNTNILKDREETADLVAAQSSTRVDVVEFILEHYKEIIDRPIEDSMDTISS